MHINHHTRLLWASTTLYDIFRIFVVYAQKNLRVVTILSLHSLRAFIFFNVKTKTIPRLALFVIFGVSPLKSTLIGRRNSLGHALEECKTLEFFVLSPRLSVPCKCASSFFQRLWAFHAYM